MAQTTYSRYFSGASAGTPGTSTFGHRASYLNDEGSATPAGIGVAYKSEGVCEFFDAPSDTIAGIVMNDMVQDPDDLTGIEYAADGAMISVLEEGAAYVHVEQTVTPADSVYCRHTSDGASNTILGKFRKDSDSGKARLVKGARFISSGSTSTPPMIWFSKAAEGVAGDQVSIVVDHAQVTADTTSKAFKTHPSRHFQVERVDYVNPTGLATDASNYFNVKLLNGATVLANWSTLTGAEGTLTADTFVAMTLNSTAANLVLNPGTEVSLFLDETGTATLPAGKLVIHGRYL